MTKDAIRLGALSKEALLIKLSAMSGAMDAFSAVCKKSPEVAKSKKTLIDNANEINNRFPC